ncbi:MAG: hypothetical protein ACLFTT_07065 [Candidatus Hydrogenedentota bacterium]
MADWRCPQCGGPLSTRVFSPEMETTCPHCGRPFDAPVDAEVEEVAVEVVNGPGDKRGSPREPSWQGKRRGASEVVILAEGGNGAGCGCGAIGCLLILLGIFLLIRGCASLF